MTNKNTTQSSPKKPKVAAQLRGKNGFNYTPKWAIIIPCESEEIQQQTYENLHALGYKCKVVNV